MISQRFDLSSQRSPPFGSQHRYFCQKPSEVAQACVMPRFSRCHTNERFHLDFARFRTVSLCTGTELLGPCYKTGKYALKKSSRPTDKLRVLLFHKKDRATLDKSLTIGIVLNRVSYLLKAVCFTRFELSIQSAFHQSLTLLVLYRSRADIEPSEPQHSVFALPRSSNVTESCVPYVWQCLSLYRSITLYGPCSNSSSETNKATQQNSTSTTLT